MIDEAMSDWVSQTKIFCRSDSWAGFSSTFFPGMFIGLLHQLLPGGPLVRPSHHETIELPIYPMLLYIDSRSASGQVQRRPGNMTLKHIYLILAVLGEAKRVTFFVI